MNPIRFNMATNLLIVIGVVYLLTMPIYSDVQYIALYYLDIIFILIPILIYQLVQGEKVQEKFYRRWDKTRAKGKLFATATEALRIFIFVIIVILSTQFVIYGNKPLVIIEQLFIA